MDRISIIGWLRREPRDDGMTLLEVIVSMTIMSVVMAAATVGMVQMYRASTDSGDLSTGQLQLHAAFLRLGKEIRYASVVYTPGKISNYYYAEFKWTDTGTDKCVGLRLDATGSKLQRRTWTFGGAPTASSWTTLATNVNLPLVGDQSATDATSQYRNGPFTVTDGTHFQQLQVQLSVGAAGTAATTASDFSFTALNSAVGTGPDPDGHTSDCAPTANRNVA